MKRNQTKRERQAQYPQCGTRIACPEGGAVSQSLPREEERMGFLEIFSMAGAFFVFLYMIDH
jgi:hypothetical protein